MNSSVLGVIVKFTQDTAQGTSGPLTQTGVWCRRMLDFKCDSCGAQVEQAGALVFSPPMSNTVRKFHVCVACFKAKFEPLLRAIFGL